MQPTTKHSTHVVEYNKDFNSNNNDKDLEYVNIDLFYIRLNLQLLINNSIIHTKKK